MYEEYPPVIWQIDVLRGRIAQNDSLATGASPASFIYT